MMLPEQKLEPFMLPPGTQVGPWKVKAYEGGGAYGLVFRAVRAGQEQAGEVALKVACYPGDPRFEREVVLLSRVDHPSVPRLLGQGEWQAPGGAAHPYLVMEWVEGLSLYTWAELCNPSNRQVLQALGQLAGAREYALKRAEGATSSYVAQPEDDVFALGVCAYRLVTGQYLPPAEVKPEQEGPWRMEWRAPRPPAELNPRVEPRLNELIVRMLSRRREERPPSPQLAEALMQAAREAGPEADVALFPRAEPVAAVENSAPVRRQGSAQEERAVPSGRGAARGRGQAWVAYVACALLGAVVSAVAIDGGLRSEQDGSEGVAQPSAGEEPVGLGDTGLMAPDESVKDASGSGRPSRPLPQIPLKEQRRAPHCVPDVEATINGGCWVEVPEVKPPCGPPSYEWQERCYVPAFPRQRQPTSEPP